MNFDYFCAVSEKHEDDFEKLSELEVLYDEFKKDKNQKKKINAKINALYENFSRTNLSLIYKCLDLHGQCNAEKFRSYCIEKGEKLYGLEVFESFKRQFIPKVTTEHLSMLPKYSFFLQLKFFLATPYISRDDNDFYIIDNPIKKDKVFKVPMVSGSSWKGNMRWVAQHIEADSKEIVNLFGNEKNAENDFKRGCLNFYPTFFNHIGLEVINPHDRKTKAGTQPIYIESVPDGAHGTFSLLYVPFNLMGKPGNKAKKEMAKDLELICTALKEMMLTYGFSAKKSSGFGIAKNELSDVFCEMNGVEIKKAKEKRDKKKPKTINRNDIGTLEEFKKSLEKKQKTFDDLEERIELIIAELLNPAASGGNNG